MIKFYSHIITVESLIVELDQMDLSDKEKLHLAHLLDETFHHTILDAVLSELTDEDKASFIKLHSANNNQEIMDFLISKVIKIEDKIKIAAEDLTMQLHKDIKESKRIK